MNNFYTLLQKLAKGNKYQNLFVAAKDLNGIRLFKNTYNFSKLQDIFLGYLYMFDSISKDIAYEDISKHVLDDEIFWTSYLVWKQKFKSKDKQTTVKKSNKDVHLVPGKRIVFPKR
jgi:hypothetical protein